MWCQKYNSGFPHAKHALGLLSYLVGICSLNFLFVCFEGGNTQGLLLVLLLGIIHGGVQETIYDSRD